MRNKRQRLISKFDALFSKFIRRRDNYTCQRCGRKHAENSSGLHCSHFWSRGHLGTRWESLNCDALCYGCHRRWEGDKQGEYMDFMLKKLGSQEKYDELKRIAKGVSKMSTGEIEVLYGLFKERVDA